MQFLLILKDESEECTGIGRYPIPNTNCSEYLLCTESKKELVGHKVVCPLNTYFNPRWRQCSSHYVCADYICQNFDVEEDVPYKDPNDKNDMTYIKCSFNEVYGVLSATYYSCPRGTKFRLENLSKFGKGACVAVNNVVLKMGAGLKVPTTAPVTGENLNEASNRGNARLGNTNNNVYRILIVVILIYLSDW